MDVLRMILIVLGETVVAYLVAVVFCYIADWLADHA